MTEPIHVRARKFLQEFFSDEELTNFCFDYFPLVYNDFTVGMSKSQKVRMVVENSQRRGRFEELLAALERERPKSYAEHFAEQTQQVDPKPKLAETTKRNPRQIFISHAHQDAEFAQRLAGDLRANGLEIWMAPDNIQPGEKWVEAINRGLAESGVFVLIISPESVNSRWVQTETNVAIEIEHRELMKFIPLDYKTAATPALWEAYQWISFKNEYQKGLHALVKKLNPDKIVQRVEKEESEKNRNNKFRAIIDFLSTYWFVGLGILAFVLIILEFVQSVSDGSHIANAPDVKPPNGLYEGQTWVRLDGMEMVFVPALQFSMGGNSLDPEVEADELPQHEVTLNNYWIDRTEVTNRMYEKCVIETICKQTDYVTDDQFNLPDHPVVGVEWADAVNYCEWVGARLPTEAEWEFAAKGNENLIYPWGDLFDGSYANYCDSNCTRTWRDNSYEDGFTFTAPVGSFSPTGDSWVGASDLAGNVWEWTTDWYSEYPNFVESGEFRVLRGGSWISIAQGIRTTNRSDNDPEVPLSAIGFRCVVDEQDS